MVYTSRIAGGSATVKTQGKGGPVQLKNLIQGGPWPGVPCKALTVRNPGSGLVTNTTSIKVGANGSAGFELVPGAVHTLENVVPENCAVDDLGTAVTIYVSWGGEPA